MEWWGLGGDVQHDFRPDWVWRRIFARKDSKKLMRHPEYLDPLPPLVTCYRGTTDEDGPDLGFSWAMKISTAEEYSWCGHRRISRGQLPKDKIIAGFDDEILIRPEDVIGREWLAQ